MLNPEFQLVGEIFVGESTIAGLRSEARFLDFLLTRVLYGVIPKERGQFTKGLIKWTSLLKFKLLLDLQYYEVNLK